MAKGKGGKKQGAASAAGAVDFPVSFPAPPAGAFSKKQPPPPPATKQQKVGGRYTPPPPPLPDLTAADGLLDASGARHQGGGWRNKHRVSAAERASYGEGEEEDARRVPLADTAAPKKGVAPRSALRQSKQLRQRLARHKESLVSPMS
jgi:hypothetical protein